MKPDTHSVVKNSSNNQLERQLQIKQLQVSALLEVTQAINNNLSSEKLFRIYEFILRAQISVNRLVVYLYEKEQARCIVKYGMSQNFNPDSLQEEIVKYTRIAYFSKEPNPKFTDFDLILPVYHKDHPLAFALLGDTHVNQYETLDEKIQFIRTITNIIVVAIENKRLFRQQLEQEKLKRELELAADVQSLLIPRTLPNNDQLEMSAVYLPHHDVGGDYYDYMEMDDGQLMFCIADISGKGIGAAILMANFQAILRTLATVDQPLDSLIERLNATVNSITQSEKFITLFIGIYDQEKRNLRYVNAGHNPPLLYRNGSFEQLSTGCTILGMFEELPSLQIGSIALPPKSLLVNYTDGLTDLENEDGFNYTIDMLEQFVVKNQNYSMAVFNNLLLKTIMDFKGLKQFVDDISILSCRFK